MVGSLLTATWFVFVNHGLWLIIDHENEWSINGLVVNTCWGRIDDFDHFFCGKFHNCDAPVMSHWHATRIKARIFLVLYNASIGITSRDGSVVATAARSIHQNLSSLSPTMMLNQCNHQPMIRTGYSCCWQCWESWNAGTRVAFWPTCRRCHDHCECSTLINSFRFDGKLLSIYG